MNNANGYILVTGTAGFIGFNLAKTLLDLGYKIIGVDNFNNYYAQSLKEDRNRILESYSNFTLYRASIEDYSALDRIFQEKQIATVCNLAAQTGVRHSLNNPFIYEKSNIEGFLNLLELVKKYKIPRLVYASSSSVYGGNKKIPFSESDIVESPISLYAATKKSNELMAHAYSNLFGIETIGLRFFSVYGPWGRPDMALWMFVDAIIKGKEFDVYNYGNMRRDFTYIDDIVDGIVKCLFSKNLNNYEIFNLGNNRNEKLLDMISIIESELQKKAKMNMLEMQIGDISDSFADIDKAKSKLNYSPKINILTGIPRFISWYKTYNKISQ